MKVTERLKSDLHIRLAPSLLQDSIASARACGETHGEWVRRAMRARLSLLKPEGARPDLIVVDDLEEISK